MTSSLHKENSKIKGNQAFIYSSTINFPGVSRKPVIVLIVSRRMTAVLHSRVFLVHGSSGAVVCHTLFLVTSCASGWQKFCHALCKRTEHNETQILFLSNLFPAAGSPCSLQCQQPKLNPYPRKVRDVWKKQRKTGPFSNYKVYILTR